MKFSAETLRLYAVTDRSWLRGARLYQQVEAALRGGDVKEAVRQGVETANDIEEGKVKRGFFGKLIKK